MTESPGIVLRMMPAASLALLISACASADHRQPEISLPAAFSPYESAGEARSLERWWLLFNDPQLTGLIDEALAHAPTALTAQTALDEAAAARALALTRFAPQGAAGLGASVQRSAPAGAPVMSQTIFSGSFAPSWELGLFGRRGALRQAADADQDAATFEYHATRQSLASNVAGSVFEARGAAIRLEQARETLRLAAELARIGERRVAAGIGSRADAASLQADEETARASVRMLEAELEVSRRTLLALLGRGTEPVDALPITSSLNAPPPVPAVTPISLLMNRPDVRQAEARLRSSAGNLKLDALAFLPTINLSPSIVFSAVAGSGGATSITSSLAQGVGIPIFDRTRLFAQLRGQRARTERAVIAYENAVQAGFAEAQNTLSLYAADRARLSSLEKAEERARYAFEAQRSGYRAGVVDLTSLLQAERTWRANLLALSVLQTQTLVDAVNVFRALGGGWPAADVVSHPAPPLPESPKRGAQ